MTTPKPEWVTGEYGTSYSDIVNSWGYELIASESFGQYQGDLVYVLRDGTKVGLVVIGYGSCSGCDALQAVEPWGISDQGDWTEVVTLAGALKRAVRWFDTPAELLAYTEDFTNRSNDWYWSDEEVKTWIVAQARLLNP